MNSLIDDCNVVDIFKVEFCSAAPTVRNSLPANLLDVNISQGQFASGLETWLFGCVYM